MSTKTHPLLIAGCLLIAGAPAIGAGCTKKKGDSGAAPAATVRPVRLAFVTSGDSERWKIAVAGVHSYEQEAKVQIDIKQPPHGTVEDQNHILQSLSSQGQGYDAIAVSVIAPNEQVGVLDKVAEKSPLITFDSDAPRSHRRLYIGSDDYAAGRALGKEIVRLLPQGGPIAVFSETLASDTTVHRLKGIEDAIAGGGIQIVDKREDRADRAKARANIEDVLGAHRDLGLVVGLASYHGTAIAGALEALGKKDKVRAAVFDADDGTLDAIASGSIQVAVVGKPFQLGYLASKWMHQLATQPEAARAALPTDRVIDTGVDIINKDNVAPFRATLAEMKKLP